VYVNLAQVLWARGAASAAEEAAAVALDVAHFTAQPRRFAKAAALQARFQLARGNLKAAIDWLAGREASGGGRDAYDDHQSTLMLARLCIAQEREQPGSGELQFVLRELEQRRERAAIEAAIPGQIELLVLIALVQAALHAHDQAMRTVETALVLAEPEGYIRTFIDEGLPMLALLVAYRDGTPSHQLDERQVAYLERLIRAGNHDSSRVPPAAVIRELLSMREHEVLQLLGAGYTAHEIASQLVISVHTVRTHLKHIYEKLNARNRIEALARARTLQLL
jgi:LuxR family maltose regulon positive regulatory protein